MLIAATGLRGSAGGGVAMSHGHSHGGGGCQCAAEREEPPEQRGLAYGLYLRIDLERLQCLNESREGSGRGVFKPWEERADRSKVGLRGPGAGEAGTCPTPAASFLTLKNNDSPIARQGFPLPVPCQPLWEPDRTEAPHFAERGAEAQRRKGRFGFTQPALWSRASVGSEGGWPPGRFSCRLTTSASDCLITSPGEDQRPAEAHEVCYPA